MSTSSTEQDLPHISYDGTTDFFSRLLSLYHVGDRKANSRLSRCSQWIQPDERGRGWTLVKRGDTTCHVEEWLARVGKSWRLPEILVISVLTWYAHGELHIPGLASKACSARDREQSLATAHTAENMVPTRRKQRVHTHVPRSLDKRFQGGISPLDLACKNDQASTSTAPSNHPRCHQPR